MKGKVVIVRVSCSCLAKKASPKLVENIEKLGIQPIVTNQVIRAVYEGKDKTIGESIVKLFVEEQEHDIYVHYDENELPFGGSKPKSAAKRRNKRHNKAQ